MAVSAITATCVGACLDPRGSSSEQQEGGAQVLTTADVRIVHNMGSGPDDYRVGLYNIS